jgi:hypothetical protein
MCDPVGFRVYHLLLKSYALDNLSRRMLRLGAIKAIHTYRDPFDAIASYMRMFNQPSKSRFRLFAAPSNFTSFTKVAPAHYPKTVWFTRRLTQCGG